MNNMYCIKENYFVLLFSYILQNWLYENDLRAYISIFWYFHFYIIPGIDWQNSRRTFSPLKNEEARRKTKFSTWHFWIMKLSIWQRTWPWSYQKIFSANVLKKKRMAGGWKSLSIWHSSWKINFQTILLCWSPVK